MREILWGAGEEDDWLPGTCTLDLLVEFSRLFRGIPPSVEHDGIVDMGLPQKSRGGNLLSFMHLDAVTSQHGGARLAGCLAAVDEENFLVSKNRAAAQRRWAVHTTLPKRARPLWEGDSAKVCAEKGRESRAK